jgi:hypothetical protein
VIDCPSDSPNFDWIVLLDLNRGRAHFTADALEVIG